MSEDFDVVASGLEMVLAVIAVSFLFLIDFSNLYSILFVFGIPLLLGYTAYISDSSFRKEVISSLIILSFIPLGMVIGIVSVSIVLLNLMTSFFASGKGFRNYYSSTALPLLLLGLILGGSAGFIALSAPGYGEQIEGSIVDYGTESTMKMIEVTGVGSDAEANLRDSAESNVLITQEYVISQYIENVEDPNLEALNSAFLSAQEEVPDRVVNQSGVRNNEQQEERIKETIETTVSGKIPIFLVIFTVSTLYAFQPVMGIITAFFSSIFNLANEGFTDN